MLATFGTKPILFSIYAISATKTFNRLIGQGFQPVRFHNNSSQLFTEPLPDFFEITNTETSFNKIRFATRKSAINPICSVLKPIPNYSNKISLFLLNTQSSSLYIAHPPVSCDWPR